MQAHAVSDYPYECCGVLIGWVERRGVRAGQVVRADNVAEGDRRRLYQIDWRTLLLSQRSARQQGASMIGFYHSHPDGSARPSQADAGAAWGEAVYLIIPTGGGVAEEPTAWRAAPNVGGFTPVTLTVSVDIAP